MNKDPATQARELLARVSEALDWTLNEVLIEFVPSDSFIGQLVYSMVEIEAYKSRPFSDFLYYITDPEACDTVDLGAFFGSGPGDMDPINIFAVLIPIYEDL